MTKDEAIQFYTVKQHRSNANYAAYGLILRELENAKTIDEARGGLKRLVSYTPSTTRRAIYRKALRELDI